MEYIMWMFFMIMFFIWIFTCFRGRSFWHGGWCNHWSNDYDNTDNKSIEEEINKLRKTVEELQSEWNNMKNGDKNL